MYTSLVRSDADRSVPQVHKDWAPAHGFYPVAELGRGGMGVAYLAKRSQAEGEEWAVIKRPHAHLMRDRELHRRFHHEALVATSVQHPSLVRTWAAGEDRHGPFLILEYVHGTTLEDLLDRAQLRGLSLDADLLAYMALCSLEALCSLHQARDADRTPLFIIHRDVSPQNILLSHTGRVLLSDLGIAKSRLRDASTDARTLLGKLPFLAPEYLQERRTGTALDVYAWGVTFWCAWAGHLPFRAAQESELVRQIFSDGVPPLQEWRSDVPVFFQDLLARACEKEWQKRASPLELQRALRAWWSSRGVTGEELLARWMEELMGEDLRQRQRAWGLWEDGGMQSGVRRKVNQRWESTSGEIESANVAKRTS